MSFVIRNLSVSAYNNGFTLWHYKAGVDTIESVCEAGYMNLATDMFATGDVVIIGRPDGVAMRYVTVIDRTTVILKPLI